MRKVFVYYELNYGELAKECDNLSDLRVFSNKEKAKRYVTEMLKIYAGMGSDDPSYEGCNRFVVDKHELKNVDIILEDGEKLSDNQIHTFVENAFTDDFVGILLYADYSDNWKEYFSICVDVIKVE